MHQKYLWQCGRLSTPSLTTTLRLKWVFRSSLTIRTRAWLTWQDSSLTLGQIEFVDMQQLRSSLLEEMDESQLPEVYGGKLSLVPIQDGWRYFSTIDFRTPYQNLQEISVILPLWSLPFTIPRQVCILWICRQTGRRSRCPVTIVKL